MKTNKENWDEYQIHWKSKITGKTGCGKKTFTKKVVNELIKDLNDNFKELFHWKVKID